MDGQPAKRLKMMRLQLAQVDSTNTFAKNLAARGAAEGTLVVAEGQTAGRGRHGNDWSSLAGNLFMSLILRPQVLAASVGQLSFLVSLALARSFQDVLPASADIGLKWPNDVLVDGRKCAGILLESEAQGMAAQLPWVVSGVGVNLVACPQGATSLVDCGAVNMTPAQFLDVFEPHISELYTQWLNEGFAPIRQGWSSFATGVGQKIQVRLTRETLAGVFEGIDDSGALALRLANGEQRHIASGEVYL